MFILQVFVSKKIEKNVRQVFDVLLEGVENYKSEKDSVEIYYDLLGKGDLEETRFVLGKIILETIGGGLAARMKVVGKEEKENLLLDVCKEDLVKNEIVVKKSRKRGLAPSVSELKLKTAKRQDRSRLDKDLTIKKQEVVREEEREQIGEENQIAVERCQLAAEEIKMTEENILEKKDCHSLSQVGSNKKIHKQKKVEPVPKEEGQQIGEENKTVETCQLLAEEEENILEKKDCNSLSRERSNNKIDKQKKAGGKNISRIPLSSFFKNK